MRLYTIILFCVTFIINSCSSLKQNSKKGNSYFILTDTVNNQIINKIVFNTFHKNKRTFVLITENRQKYNFEISEGVWLQKKHQYRFTITCIDEPLIEYDLFISPNKKQSDLKYQHLGFTPKRCTTVIKNDTIDLITNEYTDNCFKVQRLEHPVEDTFLIEYSEEKNKTNKLTIKNNNSSEQNDIDVFFPNSILWYVPEPDFTMVCLSKSGRDTIMVHFSLHNENSWYIDSISDDRSNRIIILNQELRSDVPNYFKGWE